VLLLLSGLFYLFPRVRPGVDEEDLRRANLEWYRVREQELAQEGDDGLREDARLRLLEDEQASAREAVEVSGSFPVWILFPLIAVVASALYYRLGAAPDVLISRQLQGMPENAPPEQMQALVDAVELRAAQRPENLHYVALLGRYYMGQQDYGRAGEYYGQLADEAPEDAQALAYAAQADYLAAGRRLSDQARMRAEQALAVDPHQRTALGLLGMASFEQGSYRAAVEYWQRLLAMEPPGSESANMIAGVIETARQRLGAEGPAAPAAAAAQAAAPGDVAPGDVASSNAVSSDAGVTVRVSLPAGAEIGAADTVFVLARNAESQSRMPIAVRRLQGSQLPLTLRLDDSNSMAGQKLSQTDSVLVLVQVSPGGQPGEANATWLGQAGPLAPGASTEALEIELQPREG
jgi:cytochrome c-type biogenesis protein CcmH